MNKHLKQLVDLAELDKGIDSFEEEEAKINENLNSILAEQNSHKANIETLNVELEELTNVKKKNDGLLAELTDKIKDIEKKQTLIKSEKELKALQLEDEIAKEQINHANDEIERLDRLSEGKKEEIKDLETKITELDASIEQAKKDSESELKDLDKKRKDSFKKRETEIANVPQNLLSFYQKVRRWAGSSCVVPMKKRSCYGCHMVLSERVYAEILKSEEIVTCPHCGRILYAVNEEA
ncbi:MAG: C4-type zinc ribbon domain-containing protein [Campylobacterales bacterium]|nr:C4-type zinc ribbon domain-containing protein [Campylobacterales bacterium]